MCSLRDLLDVAVRFPRDLASLRSEEWRLKAERDKDFAAAMECLARFQRLENSRKKQGADCSTLL